MNIHDFLEFGIFGKGSQISIKPCRSEKAPFACFRLVTIGDPSPKYRTRYSIIGDKFLLITNYSNILLYDCHIFQQLLDCTYERRSNRDGCNGGFYDEAWGEIISNGNRLARESDYRYENRDGLISEFSFIINF